MKVSIIILSKNGRGRLKNVLDKVTGQKQDWDFEIIVIDSGSVDGSLAIIKDYPVKLYNIRPEDFSHSKTRNFAASLASGEYLVYLSQDAEPADNDWLKKLIAPLVDDLAVGAVFGKQVPYAETNPVNSFRVRWIYGDELLLKHAGVNSGFSRRSFNFSNVNSAVRRELLLRFPFREDLFFCEDVYLAKQLLSNGYKIVYSPAAAVIHSHNHSIQELFSRYFDIAIAYKKIGILDETKMIENEGIRYVIKELKHLIAGGDGLWVPLALLSDLAKYLGFKAGAMERFLPLFLKARISKYWFKQC
jgi:glycosyltransferase involved in cell wall biosynthesis